MDLKLITAPTSEPNDLNTIVKPHCLIDAGITDFDALLMLFSGAARELIERECNIALGEQTMLMTMNSFPCEDERVSPDSELAYLLYRAGKIEVPRPPLQSVDWIKYYDTTGALVTLSPSAYEVHADTEDDCGYVNPVYNTSWPSAQPKRGAVQMQFKCGAARVTPIPKMICAAHLLIVGDMFKYRETVTDVRAYTIGQFPSAARLLAPFLVWRAA